jgi:diacylglycerol kinase family enzyme
MPPPGPICVLLNPDAGAASSRPRIAAEIAELFRALGRETEIVALQHGQDPVEAARSASARSPIVVAAGGDGTVCGVAAGLAGASAALGVLPLGTLNHFAKDLRIPLDLAGAVAVVAAGHTARIDAGFVNDRVFVNNSSIGIYPSIVDAREALRGQGYRKWPAMAVATARLVRRYRGVKVTIEIDRRRHTWRTPFVFVGNNEYTIDGSRLGSRERLDEGMLFVYMAPRLRARHLPLLLVKALAGRARQSGAFEIVRAGELWIDKSRSGRAQHVALDGEVRIMKTPLHYQMRAGALRVMVPETLT